MYAFKISIVQKKCEICHHRIITGKKIDTDVQILSKIRSSSAESVIISDRDVPSINKWFFHYKWWKGFSIFLIAISNNTDFNRASNIRDKIKQWTLEITWILCD